MAAVVGLKPSGNAMDGVENVRSDTHSSPEQAQAHDPDCGMTA